MSKMSNEPQAKNSGVTISQIADIVQLGNTTVAEILRNKPGYNAKTRQRVLEIAQRLNYRPNYLSKALAGGKSRSIGIFCDSIVIHVRISRIVAIVQSAHKNNYMCSICFPTGETQAIIEAERCKQLEDMLSRRVDGIIWMGANAVQDACFEILKNSSTPVVYVDWAPPETKYRVNISRIKTSQLLAEHLADLGHREVAFFHTPWGHINRARKIEPYLSAFRKCNVSFLADDSWVMPNDSGPSDNIYQFIKNKIKSGKVPSALLFENDESAAVAYAAINDCGLRIPDDISVVGNDGLPIAQFLRPRLTTISQNFADIGSAAFDLLLTAMQDSDVPIEPVIFDCQLMLGESTGPVKDKP